MQFPEPLIFIGTSLYLQLDPSLLFRHLFISLTRTFSQIVFSFTPPTNGCAPVFFWFSSRPEMVSITFPSLFTRIPTHERYQIRQAMVSSDKYCTISHSIYLNDSKGVILVLFLVTRWRTPTSQRPLPFCALPPFHVGQTYRVTFIRLMFIPTIVRSQQTVPICSWHPTSVTHVPVVSAHDIPHLLHCLYTTQHFLLSFIASIAHAGPLIHVLRPSMFQPLSYRVFSSLVSRVASVSACEYNFFCTINCLRTLTCNPPQFVSLASASGRDAWSFSAEAG